MSDGLELLSELSVEEQSPVSEDMQSCSGQMALTPSYNFQEVIPKKRRLTARQSQLARARVDKIDKAKVLVDTSKIITRSWRLRTHEAVAVAVLRNEQEVMLRLAPVENTNEPSGREEHYIPSLEVLKPFNFSHSRHAPRPGWQRVQRG